MTYSNELPEPIITAELVSPQEYFNGLPPQSTKKRSCLMPILIMAGLLMILAVALFVVVWRLLVPQNYQNLTVQEKAVAIERQYADARAAFTSDLGPEDDPDFNAINHLITRVASTVDSQINPGLSQVLDFERYADQLRSNPELGSLRFIGKKLLALNVQQRIIGPNPFSEFQVFKIEKLKDNERLVYLQTSDGFNSVTPSLWWIIKQNRNWRLYDWHALEYTNRDSFETAGLLGESDVAKINGYNKYAELCYEYFAFPGSKFTQDSRRPVPEILRDKEKLELPAAFVTNVNYDIALRWWEASSPVDALRVLDLIDNPLDCPGAVRLRADIYADQGRDVEAIEQYKRYENRLGSDSIMLTRMAECYRRMGKFDEELASHHQVFRYHTIDNNTSSIRIMALDSADGLAKHFDQINQRPDSTDVFKQLINDVGNGVFFTKELEQLRRYLETKHPDSEILLLAESQLAFAAGQPDEGLRLLKSSLEKSSEPEWSDFWSAAIFRGQVNIAVRLAADQDLAMQQLMEIYNWGDEELDLDELSEFLADHLKTNPESGIANFIAGQIALEKSNYVDAIKHLEIASRKLTSAESDDEYDFKSDASCQLAEAHFHNGELELAIKIANEESCLGTLVDLAIAEENLEFLDRLLNEVAADDKDREYYAGCQLALRNELDHARIQLTQCLNRPVNDDSEFSYNNWKTEQKLIEVCSRAGNITEAFESVKSESIFSNISRNLVADQSWAQAGVLLQRGRSQGKIQRDSQLLEHCQTLELDLLWYQKKYAELKDFYRNSQLKMTNKLPKLNANQLERIVRAGFYTQDVETARQAAAQLANEHFDFKMQGLVALRENNIDDFVKIRRLMNVYQQDYYLDDPDAPSLSRQNLLQIAGDRPRSLWSSWSIDDEVQWLSINPATLDTAKVEEAIQAALGTQEKIIKLANSVPDQHSWIYRSGNNFITINSGVSSFQSVQSPVDPSLRKLFEQHQTCTTISVFNRSFDHQEPTLKYAIKIGQQLVGSDCLVVGINQSWKSWPDFAEPLDQFLAGKMMRSELLRNAKYIYLNGTSGTDVGSEDWQARTEFNRELYQISSPWLKHSASPSAAKLSVTAKFSIGEATELVSIDVSAVEREAYERVSFVGSLKQNSELDPRFQRGDQVEIDLTDIVSWELQEEGKTRSGKIQP